MGVMIIKTIKNKSVILVTNIFISSMTFGPSKKAAEDRHKLTPKTFTAKTLNFWKKNIFSSQIFMIIKKNAIYIRLYFFPMGTWLDPDSFRCME